MVNIDDRFGQQISQGRRIEVIGFAIRSKQTVGPLAEVKLIAIEITAYGQNIRAATPLGEVIAVTALLGDFNAENILACIATLLALGLDYNQLELAVKDLRPIPGAHGKI